MIALFLYLAFVYGTIVATIVIGWDWQRVPSLKWVFITLLFGWFIVPVCLMIATLAKIVDLVLGHWS